MARQFPGTGFCMARRPLTGPISSPAATQGNPPGFRNGKGIVGGTLGGWELSGITRYQSGAPLTITGSAAVGTWLSSFGRRASTVPSHPLSDLPRSRGSCGRRTHRKHYRTELLHLALVAAQKFQTAQGKHEPDVPGRCV